MNFDQLYAEYAKEVEKQSNGLVQTNKAEFLKFVIFYELVRKEIRKKELSEMCKKF